MGRGDNFGWGGHIAKLSIVITAKVIFISIIKFCIDYMQNTDLLYEKTLSWWSSAVASVVFSKFLFFFWIGLTFCLPFQLVFAFLLLQLLNIKIILYWLTKGNCWLLFIAQIAEKLWSIFVFGGKVVTHQQSMEVQYNYCFIEFGNCLVFLVTG